MTVNNVVVIPRVDGEAVYDVTHRYRFDHRATVYVPELGIVPATGTFSYLTSQRTLEFRDGIEGPLLTVVALKETVRPMQTGAVEVPGDSEFPPALRSAECIARTRRQGQLRSPETAHDESGVD